MITLPLTKMKNIAEKIIYSIVVASQKMQDQATLTFVNDLITSYTQQLDSRYWKELETKKIDKESIGFQLLRAHDLKLGSTANEGVSGGQYVLESLLFVFENLHLSRNAMEKVIIKYSAENNLDARTFLSIEKFQKFIYNIFYSKDKHKAYTSLVFSFHLLWGRTEKEALLGNLEDNSFLNKPLHITANPEDALTTLLPSIYYFMNYEALDQMLDAMVADKAIHPYSVLISAVLGGLFYAEEYDFSEVKHQEATVLVQKLNAVYGRDFEFPVFENILKQYTINEFQRMRHILKGESLETYVDDATLEVYFKDDDEAHREGFVQSIILIKLALGLKKGYISPNAHIIDLHKYRYSAHFTSHIDDCMGQGDYGVEEFMVCSLRKKYAVDALIAYLESQDA